MFASLGARPLALPAPAFFIGTYDAADRPNVMAAAWAGICASSPPCLAVSIRRDRHTHAAIVRRQAFTVGVPSCAMAAQLDFTGMVSGRDEDKFAVLGLTPQAAEHVDAPLVAECPVVIELRLAHTLELGSHTQFVGEIMDVKVHRECLDEQGGINVARINPLIYAPEAREYWGLGELVARAFAVGRSVERKPR